MKKILNWMFAAILVCGASVLTSCSKDDNDTVVQPAAKEYFTLWNQYDARTALKNYVSSIICWNTVHWTIRPIRIRLLPTSKRLHRIFATSCATALSCPPIST